MHGFEGVVLTSHYIEQYYETNQADRKAWLEGLSYALKKEAIDLDLYLGSEIYFSENIVKLIQEGKASSANNSKYVLFEFPLNVKPINIEDVIYSLLEYKFVPVLAHPERYVFFQEDPDEIYELSCKGVLMQSNYGSIIGQYGKKAQVIVENLLKSNLVSFLGSDTHRPHGIYTRMDEATEKIINIVGEEKFEEISSLNEIKALKNEKIEFIEEPQKIKLSFSDKIKLKSKD